MLLTLGEDPDNSPFAKGDLGGVGAVAHETLMATKS